MVNKAEYEAYEKHRQQNATARVSLPTEEVVRPRIPFEACLSAWGEVEKVNDFATPASDPPGARTYALRSSRLLNFPDYLCVQLAKYTIGSDWLPQKLDVEIELPSSEKKEEFRVDLAGLRSRGGLQPNEVLMPDLDAKITNVHSTQPISVEPNIEYVSHLVSMGFTNLASCKACILTNNVSLETALEWIMEHLNDPTLNDPFTEQQRADSLSAQTPANEDSIAMLNAMGLTRAQAVKALNHTGHNLEAAADWAFTNPDVLNDVQEPPNLSNSSGMTTPTSANQCRVQQHSESSNTSTTSSVYELCAFISHMGKATTDGHYVAHIKRSALAKCIPNETPVHHSGSPCCGGTDDEWIIFNDEKVAKSESPPHRLAYVYVFRRVDAPID
ncbi:hypothetical protein P879_08090 [Paragonimus westermani]|uniref:Ubiquitin carboxyl-terminal hydrolase 5/13 n=1 Tax=Paragonimus westermani TaxID=34504 RepID=A0A8T0DMY4_9TREM|nr:hypothetical protein P879_08090 [Paragonimus westermani]